MQTAAAAADAFPVLVFATLAAAVVEHRPRGVLFAAAVDVVVAVVVRVPSTQRLHRFGQRGLVDHGGRHRVGRGRARVAAVRRVVRGPAQTPDAAHGHPHLRLAPDHDEYEHALQGVHQVRQVPHVVRATDHPRQHVHHPRDAHHDHQLQAHAAQGGSATKIARCF